MPARTVGVVAALLASLALTAAPAAAQRKLLVNTNSASLYVYGGLHYGGAQWTTLTSAIDNAFSGGVTTIATMSDLGQMLEYDALWVNQRWHSRAADQEIDNLRAFAATGRRVVVMGENATWGDWNYQILGAFGGLEGPLEGFPTAGCLSGRVMSVGTHALTQGVRAVNTACAGYAIGGTQLFAYNVATLWGGSQNVLTVLDANLMDDLFTAYDAPIFRSRVIDWLAADPTPQFATKGASMQLRSASVARADAVIVNPEPSTMLLLGAGVAALAVCTGRRRHHA